jgi:hypothetical protein
MKCHKVQIQIPAGTDPDQEFWKHVRAALGEGCCPRCGCRLEQVETGLGSGGMCRHCDHAWATDGDRITQWRLTHPYTGAALPLTR